MGPLFFCPAVHVDEDHNEGGQGEAPRKHHAGAVPLEGDVEGFKR